MNNSAQSKQYFEKLQEYGINNREWQTIIREINKEESGLSKLFEECRDEKGLIEKWFLTAVEEKLNKEQNRMAEFQNILQKYTDHYYANQSKIKRRDTIRSFEEEAVKIEEQALELRNTEQAAHYQLSRIQAFLMESERLRKTADEILHSEKMRLEEMDSQIRMVDYERLSADYYAYRSERILHGENIERIASEIIRTERSIEDCARALHILECARQQERLDENTRSLQRIKNKLEVAQKKEKDLGLERAFLGWILKSWYKERIDQSQVLAENTKNEIDDTEALKTQAVKAEDEMRREQALLNSRKGALQAEINGYSAEESRYMSRYDHQLVRNIAGEYETGTLDLHMADLRNEIALALENERQSRIQIDDVNSRIAQQERHKEELERKLQDNSLKMQAAAAKKNIFEQELEERRKILKYLELNESVL